MSKKIIDFRDLVNNIFISRIGKNCNEVIINNITFIAWNLTNDVEDLKDALLKDLYSYYDGRWIHQLDLDEICNAISYSTLSATHCSV